MPRKGTITTHRSQKECFGQIAFSCSTQDVGDDYVCSNILSSHPQASILAAEVFRNADPADCRGRPWCEWPCVYGHVCVVCGHVWGCGCVCVAMYVWPCVFMTMCVWPCIHDHVCGHVTIFVWPCDLFCVTVWPPLYDFVICSFLLQSHKNIPPLDEGFLVQVWLYDGLISSSQSK